MSSLKYTGRSLATLAICGMLVYSLAAPEGIARASFGRMAEEGDAPLAYVCPAPLNIMPLGDSITQGKYSGNDTNEDGNGADATDDIGYRKDLWDQLASMGYSIDLVGSLAHGQAFPFNDPEHEGHEGQTASYIEKHIYDGPGGSNWITAFQPDVILLHIGTNDINNEVPLEDIRTNVSQILDEIDEYEVDSGNTVIVILAQIINKVPFSSYYTDFNGLLFDMAKVRPDYGEELFIVNMEPELIYDQHPAGDFIDPYHPYATGYAKMALKWREAILDLCNWPPSIDTVLEDRTDNEEDIISIDVNASDPDDDNLTYDATGLPGGLDIDHVTGLISGTIAYTAAAASPYSVDVTVTDNGSPELNDTVTFTWTVAEVNGPPVVTKPDDQNHVEGETISPLQVYASDPDGDEISLYEAENLPPGLAIDSGTGIISGTIGFGANAGSPYPVSVTVTDDRPGDPKSANVEFTWTVENINQPPQVLDPPGDQEHQSGEVINLLIEASDPDGDPLTFTATGLPPDLNFDPLDGIITGKLTNASAGHYQVQVIVSDGDPELDVEVNFEWNITGLTFLPLATRT